MIANGAWFNSFTKGNVFVKPRGLMDHNPLFFEEPMQLQRFGKPFQYFNFMADIPGFLDVVATAWYVPFLGPPSSRFAARLKQAKILLKDLNKGQGNIFSNVQSSRANLAEVQDSMVTNFDDSLMHKEKELIYALNTALAQEESLLLQKTRVKWIGLGDGNNSFFIIIVRPIGVTKKFWCSKMRVDLLFKDSCHVPMWLSTTSLG